MKKLFTLTLAILFSIAIFSRPRELNPKIIDKEVTDWILDQLRDAGYTVLPEVIVQDTLNRKKSNYEKYWEEKHGQLEKPRHEPKPEFDDLYYQPSKDGKMAKHVKRDTIKKDTVVKYVTINNYYDDNDYFYANRFRHFYHPTFYWSWNFYTPYYYGGWYDPFYYDWYNPYYSHNYWWGWNNWWHAPNYYVHNDYNYYGGGYNNHFKPNVQYGRRERPSNFTQVNPTTNRRFSDKQPQGNRIEAPKSMNPQNRAAYGESRRSYAPTYETPRMGTRPQYNNSKTNSMGRTYERRTEISTESRTFSNPSMQKSTESRTQTRTYAPPVRSYNSTPSRSYGETTRSYNNSSNSGGMDRRSSGSNFSSGGNSNSSAGSSNGGSSRSSSGGGSSSGRR